MKKDRDIALDIIRCVALFCVISVHFFGKTGIYAVEISCPKMIPRLVLRYFFLVCVPLFIMLSGYLQSNKRMSARYYWGIIRILSIYLLSSIFCAAYTLCSGKGTLVNVIGGIFSFSTAPYAWYIEMYIGLFILVPFLNTCYHGLNGRKEKKILLLSMFFLTAAPSIINSFRLTDFDWWLRPSTSNIYHKLIPQWGTALWPLTYYYVGSYLREFPIRINRKKAIILLAVIPVCAGLFDYYRSYNSLFIPGKWTDYESAVVLLESVILFVLMKQGNYSSLPDKIKSGISRISEWSLGAYLVSYVYDDLLYSMIRVDRLLLFFAVVPVIFICSVATSAGISAIYNVTLGMVLQKKLSAPVSSDYEITPSSYDCHAN